MHKEDINIKNLSKVEGHADLEVKIRGRKVKSVRLKLTDNKRFFTQAIRGKNISILPQSVSRICGTCSIAHLLCCIEAIEKSLGAAPSEQTKLLRALTMYGLMIRDHALHLYLFSLPDVFGKDSVLDFDEKEHQFLHDAFEVKRAGNKLSTLIAGRAVHAPFPMAGGHARIPDKNGIDNVLKELKAARPLIFRLLDVYSVPHFDFTRKTNFVALVNDGKFDFLEGRIRSSNGQVIEEKDFFKHLKKNVLPYSQAVGYKFEGSSYMVGALARLNLNKDRLHRNTIRDACKYLKIFPTNNIFFNNLAQAVEILHSIDHSIELLETADFREETPFNIVPKNCSGVGVIEAPRGTLYYYLDIAQNGIIKQGRIIVPTQQNQINMEKDIKNLVEKNIHLDRHLLEHEIEKLIRSYDPCISCATHFLRVNWK